MKSVRDYLNSICNKRAFKYENHLIIGENATAKTYILEKILEKIEKKNVLYISVNNRGINFDDNGEVEEEFLMDLSTLNEKRVENKNDLWSDNSEAEKLIRNYYFTGKNKKIVEEYFGEKIKEGIEGIDENSNSLSKSILKKRTIVIGNIPHKVLSDGLKAIFRILLELDIAEKNNIKYILIDELEKHLDAKNCYKLIRFIQNKYSNKIFFIATHSPDIVAGSTDFNIIKILNTSKEIEEKEIELYDSNEYSNDISAKRDLFPSYENEDYTKEYEKLMEIFSSQLEEVEIKKEDMEFMNKILEKESKLPEYIRKLLTKIKKYGGI